MAEYVYPLTIHIEDTDYTGITYHPNFLKFMERARSKWLRKVGLGIEWQKDNHFMFVIHSLSIRYLQPAHLHQAVEVVSKMKKIGAASLVLEQYLRDANDNSKLLCEAEIKIACVDTDLQPRAIPDLDKVRELLTSQ